MGNAGPVPDGGGRGGGGFDSDPTLTVSPPSPYNLGNVSSAVATSFALTLKNSGRGSIQVSGVNFSSGEWSSTDVFPFSYTTTHALNLKLTPAFPGAKTVVITINNDGTITQVKYTINANAVDPATSGIAHVVPLDPTLPVGQMPTTKVDTTGGTSVGVENKGAAPFNITAAAINVGGTWFVLTPAGALPVTKNFGDPPTFFPIAFTPDDLGVFLGNLRFTTNLLAPQNVIDVPLSGLSVPFFAVSILDNVNRVILLAFEGGEIKFIVTNVYDYQDVDSVLEFNGTLWNSPGSEKTIERLQVFYENIGVCEELKFDLTVLRPSMGDDHFDVVTKTIEIGTVLADSSDRSTYVDLTATGEIMFLTITRVKGT